MTLFARYLVTAGVVDEPTVLTALCAQIDSVPAPCVLVHRSGLLTPKQQLDVLARQAELGSDYKKACVDLGLWSAELEANVRRLSLEARKPLGECLLDAGTISVDALTKALDEFVVEVDTIPTSVARVAAAVAPVVVPPLASVSTIAPTPASPTAIPVDVTPPSIAFDKGMVTDFLDLITAPRHKALCANIDGWSRLDASELTASLLRLMSDLHIIKAGARFLKAGLVETLNHRIEGLLARLIRCSAERRTQGAAEAGVVAKQGVDLLWILRERIEADASEVGFWSDTVSRTTYLELLDRVESTGSHWLGNAA